MWNAAAAGDLTTALIPAVWTFLGVVVVTLGTIAVQAQKSRAERQDGSKADPHHPDGTAYLMHLARDVGQLDQRANDNDERDDMQDRRLEVIERHLEGNDPEWRQ